MSEVSACGITPIASRTRTGSRATSRPATRPWPEVGTINVVSIRLSVVLPAPLGPSKPNSSPRLTSKLTWSTAVKVPKRLVRSRACIAADGDSIVDCEGDLGGHPRLYLAGSLQNPDLDVERANILATAADVGLGRELTLLSDRHHLPRKDQGRTRRQRHLGRTANPNRAEVGLLQIDSRPDRREIIDGQNRSPGRDPFTDFEILADYGAGDRRADDGVVRLVGVILHVGFGGDHGSAVAVERSARIVALLGGDHVLGIELVVARGRPLGVVERGGGIREIADRLGELVLDVDVLGPANDLTALDGVAFDQVELDDATGDAAGDVHLGRLDDSDRLDCSRVGRGPEVLAA